MSATLVIGGSSGIGYELSNKLPLLRQSDHPAILFFSTVAVQMGFNYHTQVASSKGAIEGAVEFLLSEKSSWITGQVLHVDGRGAYH